MTPGDLILGLLPPAGAILVEWIDLVNREYLLKDAARTLAEEGQEQDNTIQEIIAISAEGASEIVGLAPTFVSAIVSGFAILKEIQHWLWPTSVYILTIMVLTLMVIKLLRGSTCFAIADKQRDFFRGRIFKSDFRRTPKQMASYTIYVVNLAALTQSSKTHAHPHRQRIPRIAA
jgi:hypothetical protein